jgi:hypothetical protein
MLPKLDKHSFFNHFVLNPFCPHQSTAHKVCNFFLHLIIFPLGLARGLYYAGTKIYHISRSAIQSKANDDKQWHPPMAQLPTSRRTEEMIEDEGGNCWLSVLASNEAAALTASKPINPLAGRVPSIVPMLREETKKAGKKYPRTPHPLQYGMNRSPFSF